MAISPRYNPFEPNSSRDDQQDEIDEFLAGLAGRPARPERHQMTEMPKQELLVKLLKLTASSNDSEALLAVRKANDLLKNAGWTWDELMAGKIKVVEDPFKDLGVPQGARFDSPAPPPRQQNYHRQPDPRAAPRPDYYAPPRPSRKRQQAKPDLKLSDIGL